MMAVLRMQISIRAGTASLRHPTTRRRAFGTHEDGSLTATLEGHQDAVERATFSPDGSRVATIARDGTARVWDAASGKQLLLLEQSGDFPTAIFSPDGTRVLTAGDSRVRSPFGMLRPGKSWSACKAPGPR